MQKTDMPIACSFGFHQAIATPLKYDPLSYVYKTVVYVLCLAIFVCLVVEINT